jgi:hypothetical protein
MATFTDNLGVVGSCELADLLVVVDDYRGGQSGRRWAALIQAKMNGTGGGKALSLAGDLRQLDLLSRWPAFTLPAKYTSGPRDFSTCTYAGTAFDCGRYGLIAPQPNPDWRQQAPALSMPAGGHELGTFLAKMVETGQVGYGREATGIGDDWSRTVDELMTRTYASLFAYASGFPRRQRRGHSAIAVIAVDSHASTDPGFLYWGDGPPPSGGRPDGPEEEPDPGVSVLRIVIARTDEGSG